MRPQAWARLAGILMPSLVGELAPALWLATKAVNQRAWEKRVASLQASPAR